MSSRGIKKVQSVEKVLNILECFSFDKPALTLSDFVTLTGQPKATCYRLLNTLVTSQWLVYDRTTFTYRLGLKALQLGGIVLSNLDLHHVVQPYLDRLTNETSHTLLLSAIKDGHLIYIDKRESSNALRVVSEVGRVREPWFGMFGKLLLAFRDESEVDALLKRFPLKPGVPGSSSSLEDLKRRLRQIREAGYIVARDETVPNISGVAAPIRDRTGSVVAGLGVLMPTVEMTLAEERRVLNLIIEYTGLISENLGLASETRAKRQISN